MNKAQKIVLFVGLVAFAITLFNVPYSQLGIEYAVAFWRIPLNGQIIWSTLLMEWGALTVFVGASLFCFHQPKS